ncbi:FecR family protein [Sphingosinithalassobacter sp. CS137]|uniref:FecR family protein n=1 Tax=Sphingosinithalassobacter sp. CS137 TaxID=2762748 RepID=UPI00165D3631|nr:FecR domain-containing protein [Sphingosinithalassobacter sp. CS137]
MDVAMVSGGMRYSSVEAEAAAWVARLQGERTADTEAGFQAWLHDNPAHAHAFERATEIWAMLPGAALCFQNGDGHPARQSLPPARPQRPLLALAAAILVLLGFGAISGLFSTSPDYSTARGEQKIATLDDGSRIALNTNSQVDVRFSDDRRRVRLDRGEAMFEVAHDAERPFIVHAGSKLIRAVGTVFIVRRDGENVTVTLIEGKVVVSDAAPPPRGATPVAPAELDPGERLTAGERGMRIARAESIEAVTAWRRGQAIFRDTPLIEAVAELNRYGGPRLAVPDPHVAALPVSGVFATNATPDFAQAVATLHGLHVRDDGETIQILR